MEPPNDGDPPRLDHEALEELLSSLPERDRRTAIGHAALDLMSPLSEDSATALIEAAGPMEHLLDVGCGHAGLARRVLRRGHARLATGLERNPVLAARGRALAERDGVSNLLRWVVLDAAQWSSAERFGGVAIVGASQAVGGLSGALSFAAAHLEPAGTLILGEGVWVSPPPPAYLEFLGTDGSETPDRAGLEAALRARGFHVVARHLSTPEEWSAYEDPYFDALTAWRASDGRRTWADGAAAFARMQALHGRSCLGFETLVARRR